VIVFGLGTLAWNAAGGDLGSQIGRSEFEGTDVQTFTGRTALWGNVWDIAVEHPIVGTGVASTGVEVERQVGTGHGQDLAVNAHNLLLHVFLELGLVGVVLLLAVIVAYVGVTRRHPDPLRDGVASFLIVNGITEALVHEASLAVALLGAAVGAAAATSMWPRPAPHRRAVRSPGGWSVPAGTP
jgi:O-antigen ligase